MLIITTGRINDKNAYKRQGWEGILDVTVKSATTAKSLAPTWDMVMGYKKGTVSEEEYTERYMTILRNSVRTEKKRWDLTVTRYKSIVLLCYCPKGDFCHRHLLAKALKAYAEKVHGMEVVILPEDVPRPPKEPREIHHKKNGEELVTTIDEGRYYAGIGSRKTPPAVLQEMEQIARWLYEDCYILRSGGSKGADSAFERGVSNPKHKEIFAAGECEQWCLDMASKYVPSNRPPLEKMSPYIQHLLGRNMKQLFGEDGKTPVRFVVCWTPDGKDSGGTGYAIRCAQDNGIPVFNLYNKTDREVLYRDFL